MHRAVLFTRKDFVDEMMEQSFVKKCKVVEKNYKAIIYVKVSFSNYFFNKSKVIDEIHSILRPKTAMTITYEVKIKLFL